MLGNIYKTHNNNKYLKSGVYRLICRECAKGNIGQNGWNALARLNEHVQAFHNNSELQNFLRIYSKINIT